MGLVILENKINNFIRSLIVWVLLLFLLSIHVSSQAALLQESAKEYQIKAVYLYNFSYFVSWNKSDLPDNTKPFSYCVIGENPFGHQLDLTVQEEKVEGRSIKTHYLKDFKQASDCQVVFISQSEAENLDTILNFFNQLPVLTVSDIPEFIDKGGMIRFYTNRRRQVRIVIAPEILKQSGLGVSGNLLRVSEIVHR